MRSYPAAVFDLGPGVPPRVYYPSKEQKFNISELAARSFAYPPLNLNSDRETDAFDSVCSMQPAVYCPSQPAGHPPFIDSA